MGKKILNCETFSSHCATNLGKMYLRNDSCKTSFLGEGVLLTKKWKLRFHSNMLPFSWFCIKRPWLEYKKILTGKMLNIYLIPTVPLFIHLYHHIIHVSTQEYFLGYITSTERVPFFSRHQLRMWCRLIPTVLENKILGVAAPVSFQCIAAAPMAEETVPTAKCTNSFKHL